MNQSSIEEKSVKLLRLFLSPVVMFVIPVLYQLCSF